MSCLAGFGLAQLLDSNNALFNPGTSVYYRTKNFNAQALGQAVKMGFTVSPVSGDFIPGTTDTLICPQPSITVVTLKQLADAQVSGQELRAGARKFNISQTWITIIKTKFGFSTDRQVWQDPSFIGLYNEGLLYEVASYVPNELYGQPISWDIIANANEIK